jgi:hypothetical protein
MKAVYLVDDPDWIHAAKKLKEYDIHPSYWILNQLESQVRDEFNDVVIHNSFDALNSIPPNEYSSLVENYGLTHELIKKYQKYEPVAISMMERLGDFDLPSYRNRMRKYYYELSYWTSILKIINPEVAIFNSTPHLVYDYIIYAICIEENIDTLIMSNVGLPGAYTVRRRINDDILTYNNDANSYNELPKKWNEHLMDIRGDYDSAEPEYMKKTSILSKFRDKSPTIENLKKGANRLLRYYKQRKLKKRYSRLSQAIECKENCYIYFPLHYQPERTTTPEGGRYADQYLAIDLLSGAVCDKCNIVVKEHPSQFDYTLVGQKGRVLDYYDFLSNMPKVKLAAMDNDQFKLIDNALATATITGTTGWESIVRGTPSIVFGNAWYKNAPGTVSPNQLDLLSDAEYMKAQAPDPEDITDYLHSIQEQLYWEQTESIPIAKSQSYVNAILDYI